MDETKSSDALELVLITWQVKDKRVLMRVDFNVPPPEIHDIEENWLCLVKCDHHERYVLNIYIYIYIFELSTPYKYNVQCRFCGV